MSMFLVTRAIRDVQELEVPAASGNGLPWPFG